MPAPASTAPVRGSGSAAAVAHGSLLHEKSLSCRLAVARPRRRCPGPVTAASRERTALELRGSDGKDATSTPLSPPGQLGPPAAAPPADAAAPFEVAQVRGGGGGGGGVPHRWRLVAMMSAAFVLCNMDKVNMSVAVIPMAADLGWSGAERGLVSSSFFWGYALTQVPAGWTSTRVGGARVLLAGVGLWSLGTLLAPPAAALGLPALCGSRVLVGLGEGLAPAAATSVLARQVPSAERARAVSAVWGGLDVGSVVGLLVAGPLIREYGWPAVFYLFAALGGAWCLAWPLLRPDEEDPAVKEQQCAAAAAGRPRAPRPPAGADAASGVAVEEARLDAALAAGSDLDEPRPDLDLGRLVLGPDLGRGGARGLALPPAVQRTAHQQQQKEEPDAAAAGAVGAAGAVPWRAFMTSRPVWAVTVAHFCFNWGYYTLLAWLPSYFELALGLDVQSSSFLTLIPYVAMAAMTPVVGPAADGLAARGWPLTRVRKACQGVAFVGPAACMVACAALTPGAPPGGGGGGSGEAGALVALLSLAFALSAWSRAGLYCNHQDLSPKYASALLGITNTAGAMPGVLGVTAAGYLLDATGSWGAALFLPAAAAQLAGAAVYTALASSERQPWS
ncbi:MAG: carbohydrate transporter [Monoraphidium minutum]|nr:MAG: carbohydrate transporter [Monoraphidium minutum]